MTTDRELLQQALDALEVSTDWDMGATGKQAQSIRAITALRARLAQPEQEIESDRDHVEDDGCPTEKAVLQRFWREHQAQEPVAQVDYNERGNICWLFGKQVPDKTLLYTAPPQSEWQNAALRLGEELSTVGPDGYYNMSASEWLDWAMKHITPARIEQEPVAWWHDMGDVVDLNVSGRGIPLYIAPPQREWQGLTDEELSLLWVNYHGDNCLADGRILSYEQAIEAKLKEKNT